jgi:predicted nucleic acid-binding protein
MQNKPSLVINTSPLVALAAALDDFHVLAGVVTLVVPGEVMAELEAGAGLDETAKLVRSAAWCAIRKPFATLPPALLGTLGSGEAGVNHTALSEGISTVVIDERKGRRLATLHGLRVTGSLGLLLALRKKGLGPTIPQAITRMQSKGIHLSDRLVSEALRLAGPNNPS